MPWKKYYTPAAQELAAAPQELPRRQLVHHVFFWLQRPGHAGDTEALLSGIRALAAIPHIRQLMAGTPAATGHRDVVDQSYDVSELAIFASEADEAVYQDHPLHHQFVEAHKHLWSRVVVYDTWMEVV